MAENAEIVCGLNKAVNSKISTVLIEDYKQQVQNLAIDLSTDVFSKQFMDDNKVQPTSMVAIVSGHNLNPELFGHYSIPAAQEYIFFYVVPQSLKPNEMKRILVCQHDISGQVEKCGHTRTDFSKFFDHMRTHSGERPYIC